MADGRWARMLLKALLLPALAAAVLALSWGTASADSSSADTAEGARLSGDNCIECHLKDDPRVSAALSWGGGVYRAQYVPCDPVRIVREQYYHAENLMLKIAQTSEDFSDDRMGADALAERLDPQRDAFDELTGSEVSSVTSFSSGASAVRFQTAKILPDALNMHEETRRRNVIMAVVFGTIFLAFLGVFGYERTLKR